MYSENFKASVQYGDWKGTSAADDADQIRISSWLKENSHMEDNDFLVGVKVHVGENHGEHKDPVSVSFMVLPLKTGETVEKNIASANGPVEVKVVRIDMTVHEFLAFFKRVEVVFSRCKAFDGCEYREI
ncbi:hypothetical protein [Vibrio cholerae]|uniref:hypothetical protein n=1 Tax=Vibrio cholerae TaxID=666 RepID=UPI00155EF662|nr:hypothetical protein [Vibrio cholerae]MDF4536514.1 hypothetical protein [Vibrio parahaemolyticus]EGQ8118623.1 hypothetical protein [Vibrio cholerae]EJL6325749.1 hypothetical protein [Vibrio cholerae]EJL6770227.1 hypothetical protein [Vibrio cholerae]MCD6658319.1 hypothetical protein [Vibrio cholerae]